MQKLKVIIRQAIFTAILMFCAVSVHAQINIDTFKFKGLTSSYLLGKYEIVGTSLGISNSSGIVTKNKIDTVKCYYLEVVSDTDFTWKTGHIVTNEGYVEFDNKVHVSKQYLPTASGLIKSPIFDLRKRVVKNDVIKVVLVK